MKHVALRERAVFHERATWHGIRHAAVAWLGPSTPNASLS